MPEQWNSDKITIHPNKNVGGAGGFTRGMIESMEQPEDITHVLLMDDDVIILPESIRRMYYLLSMLKPEFDEYFVSGARLCYEEMNIQHEDIGFVHADGSYGPQKNELDHIIVAGHSGMRSGISGSPAYVCRMVVLLYSYEDD